jgi:predicted AAA+ superfamily ATPase
MWIHRNISGSIKLQCRAKPALLVTGPRQVGKSSLLRHLFPDAGYISFDDRATAAEALNNPKAFFDRLPAKCILDEVQYVPEIFRDLKMQIDLHRNDRSRIFLLTGSQKFSLMKNAAESLAGRISIFELQSLSAAELRLANLPTGQLPHRGGYPELWIDQTQSARKFYGDYINTYLERDVRSVLQVGSLRDFDRCLRSLALRVGSLINFSDIAKDVGVSANTAKAWIGVLEASGIIHLLEPFFDNQNKRLIKSPKVYFCDNGLLCYLLQLNDQDDWRTHLMAGKIWENFVFTELLCQTKLNGLDRSLFFWREKGGREIDFLIERSNGVLLIDAKLSENPDPRQAHFKLYAKDHSTPGEFYFACTTSQPHTSSLSPDHKMWNPLLSDGPI